MKRTEFSMIGHSEGLDLVDNKGRPGMHLDALAG